MIVYTGELNAEKHVKNWRSKEEQNVEVSMDPVRHNDSTRKTNKRNAHAHHDQLHSSITLKHFFIKCAIKKITVL